MFFNRDASNARDAPAGEARRKPGEQDLRAGAVQRAVLKESLEHPATIYPAAGSLLSLIWTVAIAPSPASLIVTLGCAFIGVSSFIYSYIIKGEERAAAQVARLLAERRQFELDRINEVERLCQQSQFYAGVDGATALRQAYAPLVAYFNGRKDARPMERYQMLAEETFLEGVRIFDKALALFTAMQSIDADGIKEELESLKTQQEMLQEKGAKARSRQVESLERQLAVYRQRQEEVEELLSIGDEIASALKTNYLELVDLGSRTPHDFFNEEGDAAERFNLAIAAARRVDERMRNGDGKSAEDDALRQKYIRVSKGLPGSDAEAGSNQPITE